MDLPATLAAHNGMGLAAPQLGELLRVFVLRTPRGWTSGAAARAPPQRASAPFPFTLCVNPRVLRRSEESLLGMESCLSLEGEPLLVRRSVRVEAAWEDGEGGSVEATLEGLPAVVFQHELDHLDGALIIDREERVAPRERDAVMSHAGGLFREAYKRYYGERLR